MKLARLHAFDIATVNWEQYDAIFLASGFEDRSIFLLDQIPMSVTGRCHVLGFSQDRDKLSREKNDEEYLKRGLHPLVEDDSIAYEKAIHRALRDAAGNAMNRPMRIFVDYSVMTRAWYGYILTWIKYSQDVGESDVDFAYCFGNYDGEFEPLQIEEISAISGFEGGCAGARKMVAFYGLGYDRYATLAVHELIEPDSVVCYIARESDSDPRSEYVLNQNRQIVEISGAPVVDVPLGNLEVAFRILHEQFAQIPEGDEIIAVPMGPKSHVLATLMVAQFMPRVTCLHARGSRKEPIQVTATGVVSAWTAEYR